MHFEKPWARASASRSPKKRTPDALPAIVRQQDGFAEIEKVVDTQAEPREGLGELGLVLRQG